MDLNSNYQYIGRTQAISCDGGWDYYVLLYAKTSGDISTGKHTVSVQMYLASTSYSSFYLYSTNGSVTVNGSSAISWTNQQNPASVWTESTFVAGGLTYYKWILLGEGSVAVDTGYGASTDVVISASWNRISISGDRPNYLPYTDTISANIAVTLPMIVSSSTITSADAVTLDNACNVKWTPQAASFRYKLKFAIGNWSYTTEVIHPNKTTEYTYTGYRIPLEVAHQFTTKTGTMTVTLYTYSDSRGTTQIGTADSETFTVTVPDNEYTQPTIPSIGLVAVNKSLSQSFDGLYIQGKSKVRWQSGNALGQYGARIVSYSMKVGSASYGFDSSYTSDFLNNYGTVRVTCYATDSRGHSGSTYQDITVIPYRKPVVQAASGESNIMVARCDADGRLSDSGTYLKIKAKLIYEKIISDGVQNNFGKIQFRYRAEGGATWSGWQTILDSAAVAGDEITTGALLNGDLSIEKNYLVQIQAIDNIEESAPVTFIVQSDAVYMHRPAGGKSMGLGGYSSGDGNLDIYWKTKARGGLSVFNETGEELDLNSILPLPRGLLGEGWDPNDIANGVHEVRTYPLKDPMGNILMENGALIQLAVDADGLVKLQMAFPTDTFTPVYRLKRHTDWSDWLSFKN